MSLSKILARKSNGPENKIVVGNKNAISESSSDSEYSSFGEVHEAFVEITNFEDENEIPPFAVRMLNLGKEFAIFCLIMLTYAAFTKDPPKVSKPPAAYPFFPEDSIINDWYRGQISTAIETTRSSDVTFVMYYAPWDAESQAARREFEEAAKFLKKQVSFAAVNCWNPNSECRQQYSKVYKWPVFIAYPSQGLGIQYSGPNKAVHMIRFLQKISNPVVRLTTEKPIDFDDVYVVASIKTLPGSTDFIIYYIAALKYLERDPQHRITFYVNSTLNVTPQLTFYLWNETLIFPINDKRWTSDEILKWIYKNVHQVSSWVLPNAIKSIALSKSIDEEPALILFTPRNPLHPISDYYSLLQEIGQQYYNCDDLMLNPQSVSIEMKRAANVLKHNNLIINCKMKQKTSTTNSVWKIDNNWSNTSGSNKDLKFCTLSGGIDVDNACSIAERNCRDISNSKTCGEQIYTETYTTSILKGHNDPRSSSNLLTSSHKEICRNFILAEKYHPAVFESKPLQDTGIVDVTGLACKSNKSLGLLAMDSLMHYHFAEKLGINLSKYKDNTAAVIVDGKMESHYILEEPVNGYSLRNFILNFTNNKLSRSFKSITNLKEKTLPVMGRKKYKNFSKVVLEELNSSSFLPKVMEKNKAVIVFFYTKQCSFCSGFSHIFLTLARKFRLVENLVFTRIDGEENILPWEYTMETYPTILLFPSYRKSESRVFQTNVPITLSNLLGFILANIDPQLKIGAIWSLCLQMKPQDETSCYFSLLKETLAQVDQSLKDWRKTNGREKSKYLYKLRQLQQLHLLFAHHPHNYQLITSYFEKFKIKFNFSDFSRKNKQINVKHEL